MPLRNTSDTSKNSLNGSASNGIVAGHKPVVDVMFGAGIVAIVAGFALTLQFALILGRASSDGVSMLAEVVRFFSYFTILTNLLVAAAASAAAFAPDSRVGRWFARPSVAGAVAAYIAFVGIVYELLLRHTWNPQGWQRVADTLLHDATPLLFVANWVAFVPRRALRVRDLGWWLLYPIAYVAYAMARGAVTGAYPYHFLDPSTDRARASVAAIVLLCVGIVVLCATVFALDRVLPVREVA
jgi:hypothetical protein